MGGMLEGKVAMVTGSGRGIRRGIALALAREGARVVVNDVGCDIGGRGTAADGLTHGITKAMEEGLIKDAAFPKRMGRPEEYARMARAIFGNVEPFSIGFSARSVARRRDAK